MCIGESATKSPSVDVYNFIKETKRISSVGKIVRVLFYTGKASRPIDGTLFGPGSRQLTSFKEHLPLGYPGRINRPNGGSAKIIAGGDIVLAASFFYDGLSEVAVDKELTHLLGEDWRLNMIATNGLAKSNSYLHLYAVIGEDPHCVVHPPRDFPSFRNKKGDNFVW